MRLLTAVSSVRVCQGQPTRNNSNFFPIRKMYNLQEEENVIIPKLEKQIVEKQKEIDNIVKAIQLGAVSESLMKKLNELESQKRLFEEELAKEKIKMPILTVKEFKMALLH